MPYPACFRLLRFVLHGRPSWVIFCQIKADSRLDRRAQSAYVRILLANFGAREFGQCRLQSKAHTHILHTPQGEFFVSFSHSPPFFALVVSSYPCAIDTQYTAVGMHVAQRFFHPKEIHALAKVGYDNTHITHLWRLKEAFGKLEGGLAGHLGRDYSATLGAKHTLPHLFYLQASRYLVLVFEHWTAILDMKNAPRRSV